MPFYLLIVYILYYQNIYVRSDNQSIHLAGYAGGAQKRRTAHNELSVFFVSALPIFPGRRQPSIFGADELNCRVRDGNGWTLTAISTDCYLNCSHTVKTNMKLKDGDPCGNRTHVCGVRGRRLSRLTNGPHRVGCVRTLKTEQWGESEQADDGLEQA